MILRKYDDYLVCTLVRRISSQNKYSFIRNSYKEKESNKHIENTPD